MAAVLRINPPESDIAANPEVLPKCDVTQSTGENERVSRLVRQLERLRVDGCCPPGDMVVFPISSESSSLAELARTPGVTLERIGPDVVRVRREA